MHLMDKLETFSSYDIAVIAVFGVSNSDGCEPNAPADIRSIFSHSRVSPADKISFGRAHKERHTNWICVEPIHHR